MEEVRGGQSPSLLQTVFTQELIKRGILTRAGKFICQSQPEDDVDPTLSTFRAGLEVVSRRSGPAMPILAQGDIIGPVIRASWVTVIIDLQIVGEPWP